MDKDLHAFITSYLDYCKHLNAVVYLVPMHNFTKY